jgi:hypothetical protein
VAKAKSVRFIHRSQIPASFRSNPSKRWVIAIHYKEEMSFLSGMRKLISFVDRTRVESALTLAFLVSLAWVCALALLLRTNVTHSIEAESKPPLQHAAPLAPTSSSSN